MQSEPPFSNYEEIVDKALSLHYYDDTIYERAIIAASRLNSYKLAESYFHDPVFHMVLTKQKYSFYQEKKTTRGLTGKETELFEKLEFQISVDEYNRKYYTIFGNSYQKLALGLADQDFLLTLLNSTRGLKQSLILPFLDYHHLEKLNPSIYRNVNLMKLAKADFNKKLQYLQTLSTEAEKLAILQYTTEEDHQVIFNNYIDYLDSTPVLLKFVSLLDTRSMLKEFVDSPSPYIRAMAIYKLLRRSSQNEVFGIYEDEISDLFLSHKIFIPVHDRDELYYQLLMQDPDHTMVDYLIHSISDLSLLQKLMFHTQLRGSLRERIDYLTVK